MTTPEEREAAQKGASGGHPASQKARNPSSDGERKPRKSAGSATGTAAVAAGNGRPESEDGGSSSQRKRARRRKRGKTLRAKTNVPPETASDDSLQNARTSSKLSNRRRRARRKKQSRQQINASQRPQENAAKAQDMSHNEQAVAQANGVRKPFYNQQSRQQPPEQRLYAALDLGTNNCRLLIASPTRPGQFRVVDAFSRIVRLGEGLSKTGRLSDPAMQRAIDALKVCSEKLRGKKITRSRLIATEACRSAENGQEFIQRVREVTGLELEIVDRQTEARLAVSGCGTLVARDTDAVVLFDIGGGSSEIALIDVSKRRSPRLADHIIAWTSLPVGVVTLAERFGGRNVTAESFATMVDHVTELLQGFKERNSLGELVTSPRFHLLGTSGTVTTLAGIHLGLDRYDRRRVDGMWMGAHDVSQMTRRLLSWDFDARVANPCIGADRADLVLGGCAILDAIRKVWPSEKLLVADRGLREGILTELMSHDGAWRHNRANSARHRH
ncbi:Ppx/GppA phosphatase family protein [Daeguia caeni]|uniref:Ppx/GppA phosphatase family protein n=1 Tax=Daeguia caeni TaxID=439612 RepID=A0ABV9H792_9HYPH